MQSIFGLSTTGIKTPKFDGSQGCAFVDPELFFPEDHEEAKKNLPSIRAVCNPCSFRSECLEYALSNPELQGIWAATTVQDRKRMRRFKRVA